jgi:hypothetical protein
MGHAQKTRKKKEEYTKRTIYEKDNGISPTTASILRTREDKLQGRHKSPLFSSCDKLRESEQGSDNNLQLFFISFNKVALWWSMKQFLGVPKLAQRHWSYCSGWSMAAHIYK